MKTYILRLETQDDATSIRDKITWAKAARILMAFPKRRPPTFSRLEMTLIQRAAFQSGGQLAFVTRNADIIRQAAQLGIPVFSSISSAQRLPWLVGTRRRRLPLRRRSAPPDIPKLRENLLPVSGKALAPGWKYLLFFSGIASVLALLLMLMPAAHIEIPLSRKTQTISLTIRPRAGLGSVLPGGQVPAADIKTIVEGQLDAPATGETLIPDKPATAVVLVTNLTASPLTIPAGTEFTTLDSPPVRFLTLSSVELPAGNGQRAEVRARAALPGSSGNVPAGAINAVPGQLGLQVNVTNPADAEGGSDALGRSASEADFNQLYDSLLTSLTDTALHNLESAYGKDLVLIPNSIKVEQIVEEKRQPVVNSPADRLKLALVVEFSAQAVSRLDLEAVAATAMDAVLSEDWMVEPGSYTFDTSTPPVVQSDARIVWDLQISRELIQVTPFDEIKHLIKGRERVEAQSIIQTRLGLNQAPIMTIFPAWWPRLPWLAFRIEVAGR